jgi:hypothetical protein
MELGKAKYGSGKTTFKIVDGDNVYRILPPMGKLAKVGKWNQYYRVEWGFKNSEGRNRPFQDVRKVNYQNQMVEVESAAHLQREELKAQKTALVEQLKKNPTDASLKQKVGEVTEDIKRYNLDAKYYVNAIALDGKIGLLKLGSRAFKALKAEIDTLRKAGIDPLSIDQGRFFNFRRTNETGNFQDTAYQVTVYKEQVTVNGETYEKAKAHVIDQSIIDRLSDEAFELSGMYPEVTAAQVERMVKEGPTAVDAILGSGNDRGSADDGDDGGQTETKSAATTTATAAAPKTEAAPAPAAKVEAAPAATPAAKTETITPATVAAAKETKAPVAPAKGDLSEDDFLRSIGALK